MLWRQVVSQSPVSPSEFAEAREQVSAYRKGLENLNRLVKSGGSLSGFERNCAFLNTRDQRFATVSAVSGFDFLDDGRAIAVSDWDGDGDVDIWLSNRTAPRVRFLQNQTRKSPTDLGRSFITVRLEGKNCNRDAIGARVTLTLEDGKPLVKALRAGEGYLGQSSKTLHFGLGEHLSRDSLAQIERMVVRWPHGDEQTFRNLPINRHYRIVEGDSVPHTWTRPDVELKIELAPQPEPPANTAQRIVLGHPLPAPALRYQSLQDDGGIREVGNESGPVLLNLWATWCGPCMKELVDLQSHYRALQELGLNVVAVAVDGQVDGDPAHRPQEVATRLELTFPVGTATDELMARIERLNTVSFGAHAQLPVPTSLLLDHKRRVCVVYRGPLDIGQLQADVRRLEMPTEVQIAASYPLPGVWNHPPAPPELLLVPLGLMERRQVDDAWDYAQRWQHELAQNHEFPKLLVWIGDELIAKGRKADGLDQYRQALTVDSNHLSALNNLAWILATDPNREIRDGREALKYAQQAVRLTKAQEPSVLDTLAACYAELGRFDEGLKVIDRAILLEQETGESALLQSLIRRRSHLQQRRPVRGSDQ